MKSITKSVYRRLAYAIALLYIALVKLYGFWHMSVWVGTLKGPIGCKIRYFFYKEMLNRVGKEVNFVFGCNFSYPNISIGNNVRIGLGTNVGLVDIGDDTRIGAYCNLLSGSRMHGIERTDIPIRLQPGELTRISIARDCWLGANVTVMANIGEGCVVGSGSVVTKPIPPWSIAVGNPAKVIKSRQGKQVFSTSTPNDPDRFITDSTFEHPEFSI